MEANPRQSSKNIDLAFLDDLTGIYNRRYLYKYLSEELPKLKTLALFMMDLDGFKKINDTYGHLEGDAILVAFSQAIQGSVGELGIVMRYAGDEFIVALPRINKEEAIKAAGKIIEKVSSQPLKGKDQQKAHAITTSLGVAIYPDDAVNVEDLVDKADQALYSSKRTGKNKFSTVDQISSEIMGLNKTLKGLSVSKFIDRLSELEQLGKIISTKSANPKAALIGDTKGIGKTRLLDEFILFQQTQGIPFIKLKATEDGLSKPYGLLTEGLNNYLQLFKEPEIKQIISALEKDEIAEVVNLLSVFKKILPEAKLVSGDFPEKKRASLFKGLGKILEVISGGNNFILAVDDFHWADPATVNLITGLLKNKDSKLMIFATYLKETESKIAPEGKLPFQEFLEKPENKILFSNIILSTLTKDSIKELLSSVLEGIRVSEEFLEEIYKKTQGNPLFTEEILRFLMSQGLVYYKDNKWQLGDISKAELPGSFEEAEKSRFEKLDSELKETLINAAFMGEDFNIDVLKKVSQKNEGQLLDIIDEASKLGVIKPKPGGSYEFNFANRQSKDVLYNLLDAIKAKEMHHKIASTLEYLYKDNLNSMAGNIMLHYERAQDKAKAQEYANRVSDIEKWIFAPDEAAEYFQSVAQEEPLVSEEELLEKPLSAESKRILADTIIALRGAIESALLYPSNNQARINYRSEAFSQLSKLLEVDLLITFSIVDQSLLINGEELEKKDLRNTLGRSFATFLNNYRINSLTFKNGVTEVEFAFFLDSITRSEDYLNKMGGLAKLLKDNNVSLIKIDQVRYEKAHKISSKFKKTKDILKNILMQYPVLKGLAAEGEQSTFKPTSKDDLKEAMKSLGSMIKNISQSKEDVGDKAEMIITSLSKIADPVSKADPEQWKDFKKELGSIFSSLEPDLKTMVIKKDLDNLEAPGAVINDMLAEESDHNIVNTVSEDLKKKNVSIDDVSGMLKVVLADPKRRERLAPVLEKELLQSGLSKEDVAAILSQEPVISPSVAANSPAKESPKDPNSIIEDLLAKNKDDVVESLVDKMLRELSEGVQDLRKAVIADLGSIIEVLLDKGKNDLLIRTILKLIGVLEKNLDSRSYNSVAEQLAKVIKGLLYKENYLLTKKLTSTLKSQASQRSPQQEKVINEALGAIIDPRISEEIAFAFTKDPGHAEDSIISVLLDLGVVAVVPLIKLLEEEDLTKDPFDLYVRRRKISSVLKKFGADAVEKLKGKLSESDPRVLKNYIEAIGYLEDKSVVPQLEAIVKHPDVAVREELVTALRKLWGPQALKAMVEFLKDPNAKVHKRARTVLLELSNISLIPELEKFFSDPQIGQQVKEIAEQIQKKARK